MPACPNCGAENVPTYRFCWACGVPLHAARPRAPYPPYPPPRTDNSVLRIVAIVVVVIAVCLSLAAALFIMASTPVTRVPTKPAVALTVTNLPAGADVLVAGIQPATSPSNFKVNVGNVSSGTYGTATNMPATPGNGVSVLVGSGATAILFIVSWQNPGGSGQVSQGDHFVITAGSGPYSTGTTFSFLLLWGADGSILATVYWQA